MIGLVQIIIYLLCAYLVYKGCEIFQIAFVSRPEQAKTRTIGIMLGIITIVVAIAIGLGAIIMSETIAKEINDAFQKIPGLKGLK